jgi:putative membrane protein
MATAALQSETKSKFLINVISIVVPIAVAVMLAFPNKVNLGDWTKNLSHVIGVVNSLTTIVLIAGLIFIKRKRIDYHRIAMTTAFWRRQQKSRRRRRWKRRRRQRFA